MISDRLFVYGTLMRSTNHPMAKRLSRGADFLGEGTCRGRLYLVKHYPGLVLADDPADIVHGELYRLHSPADALLRRFDDYEGCGPAAPQPAQYARIMLPITQPGRDISQAWAYIYNWPATALTRIASGRFSAHQEERLSTGRV